MILAFANTLDSFVIGVVKADGFVMVTELSTHGCVHIRVPRKAWIFLFPDIGLKRKNRRMAMLKVRFRVRAPSKLNNQITNLTLISATNCLILNSDLIGACYNIAYWSFNGLCNSNIVHTARNNISV